ncbi:MAG: TIR domain-containing protein [Opitutae bacterium]|nr:TIR domain-containing protein [Opitutae bacterium]
MSDPANKAVFLSYASQDAEAAKRICEALRSGGVEVWFDSEGGLETGDEWDAKIRRQIRECVLFIPIISANTQARHEGYFRIEWELAAQRALGIASGVAFILPVVIDDTREPAALVPDRFRMVQWTRLPGGSVPSDVLQPFLRLWSHRAGVVAHQAAQSSAASDNMMAPLAPRRRVAVAGWGVAVLAIALAAGAFFLFRPTTDKGPVGTVPVAAPAPESLSEARRLAQRARAVFDATTVVRQDMELAEQLVQKAQALDPTDAYVWAVAAQVDAGFNLFAYDSSETRRGQAFDKAEKALRLEQNSFEARLAKAFVLTYAVPEGAKPTDALPLVESLLREQPDNRRALLILGWNMQVVGRLDEAVIAYRKAHDRWAEGWALLWAGRLAEIEAVAEAGFKAGQANTDRVAGAGDVRQALMLLLSLNLRAREDLEAAQAVMERMPPDELREDETACYAADLRLMRREPERVGEIMRSVPRDWMVPRAGGGPYKAYYSALALELAHHPEAAAIEWRAALKLVEERLATRANAPELVKWKALLLARLGETEEATRLLRLAEQLAGRSGGEVQWETIETYLILGRRDEVLAALPRLLQDPFLRFWIHAYLRFDPRYDSLRGDPRFEKILRDTRPANAKPFADQPPAPPSAPSSRLPAPVPAKADEKSVAVLAFANLSDDKSNEYFSDGISEELLNVLAKIPGLKVTARTSAFHFKGKDTPIPEIAQQLGVAYVVEGSVRKAGDKVRITAQLIKAADGFHVWSDTFTRNLKDIFAVQDEIAGLIAQNLRLKLDASGPAKKTVHPEAYALLLEGRFFIARRSEADFVEAEKRFRRALEIDADFAPAFAGIADAAVLRGTYGLMEGSSVQPADFARAREAARRAMELDPTLAEPHHTLGLLYVSERRFAEADREFAAGFRLNPNYGIAYHWRALLTGALGRFDEAIADLERAISLDPLATTALFTYARFIFAAGQTQEALAPMERAIALRPSFFPAAHSTRALFLLKLGRTDEALAEARLVRQNLAAPTRWWADGDALYVLKQAGAPGEAEAYLSELRGRLPADSHLLGYALLAMGGSNEAWRLLAGTNPISWTQLFWAPMMEPHHHTPPLRDLFTRLAAVEHYDHARATIMRLRQEHEAKK